MIKAPVIRRYFRSVDSATAHCERNASTASGIRFRLRPSACLSSICAARRPAGAQSRVPVLSRTRWPSISPSTQTGHEHLVHARPFSRCGHLRVWRRQSVNKLLRPFLVDPWTDFSLRPSPYNFLLKLDWSALARHSFLYPFVPSAPQRSRSVPSRSPKFSRHTGACGFVWSSTQNSEHRALRYRKPGCRSHRLIWRQTNRVRNVFFALLIGSFATSVDHN